MKNRKKTLIITAVVVVAIIGAIAGLFVYLRSNRDPAKVYSAADFSSTDDYAFNNSTYGSVRADNLQTVYLSDTQTVVEVHVQEGDTVHKGDPLVTCDSTLTDMQLTRKRLEIQQQERELRSMKVEYNTLAGKTVYPITELTETTTSAADSLVSRIAAFSPLVLTRLSNSRNPDDSQPTGSDPSESADPSEPSEPFEPSENPDPTGDPDPSEEPKPPLPYPGFPEGSLNEDGAVEQYYFIHMGDGSREDPYRFAVGQEAPFMSLSFIEALLGESSVPVYGFFARTVSDMPDTLVTEAWGVCFARDLESGQIRMSFFNVSNRVNNMINDPYITNEPTPTVTEYPDDPTEPSEEPTVLPTNPYYPPSYGPSASEIAAQKKELQTRIRDLDLSLRMSRVELAQMEKELGDNVIRAELDGVVTLVGDAADAALYHEPMMKISGGGGYYVDGYVSELALGTVYEGQNVRITDWDSGAQLQGTVERIYTIPAEGGWVDGNPNATCYTYTVFIPESEDLQEGHYVEMALDTAATDFGTHFYLDNAFILRENGKSYVFVQSEDGLLEKREVSTGRDLWGSYTEILSGVTAESYVAFPYQSNVEEGVKTVVADSNELWAY